MNARHENDDIENEQLEMFKSNVAVERVLRAASVILKVPVKTLKGLAGKEPSMLVVPTPLDWAYTPNEDNAVMVYFDTTEKVEEFIGVVRNSMIGDAT